MSEGSLRVAVGDVLSLCIRNLSRGERFVRDELGCGSSLGGLAASAEFGALGSVARGHGVGRDECSSRLPLRVLVVVVTVTASATASATTSTTTTSATTSPATAFRLGGLGGSSGRGRFTSGGRSSRRRSRRRSTTALASTVPDGRTGVSEGIKVVAPVQVESPKVVVLVVRIGERDGIGGNHTAGRGSEVGLETDRVDLRCAHFVHGDNLVSHQVVARRETRRDLERPSVSPGDFGRGELVAVPSCLGNLEPVERPRVDTVTSGYTGVSACNKQHRP